MNTIEPDTTRKHLLEACHTILFASTSMHRTIRRCIHCALSDNLSAIFEPVLQKSKASSEKLVAALEQFDGKLPIQNDALAMLSELLRAATTGIGTLKELCDLLKMQQLLVMEVLDTKFTRNLLLNVHGATLDLKDAWQLLYPLIPSEAIQPTCPLNNALPTHPSPTFEAASANSTSATKATLAPLPIPQVSVRDPHFKHVASPLASPLISPSTTQDNVLLLGQLEQAMTGTLEAIRELKQWKDVPSELDEKLSDLESAAEIAEETTLQLKSRVADVTKEETDECIKIILSIMIQIRESNSDLPKEIKLKLKKCYGITRAIVPNSIASNTFPYSFSEIPLQRKNSQLLVEPSHKTDT